ETVPQAGDDRRQSRQLHEVGGREALEDPPPARREIEAHDPPVLLVDDPADEARLLGAVDELHGAVVAQKERVGHVADRRRPRAVVAPDRQQELVLLAGETGGCRLLVAPPQEAAQSRSECQQLPELAVAQACRRQDAGSGARCPSSGTTSTGHGGRWTT